MTCRNCAHVRLPEGQRRLSERKAYQCDAPVPTLESLCLPQTILKTGFRWPPGKAWVWARDGDGCPAWKQRT